MNPRSLTGVRRACHKLTALTALLALSQVPAAALPHGKAWTPVAQFGVPEHSLLFPDRMDVDSAGIPLIFADARGGVGKDLLVLRWGAETWQVVTRLGNGTKFVHPVVSPPGTHYLVWNGLDEIETPTAILSSLVLSEFAGDTISRPDTIARVRADHLYYPAAVSAQRRWAAGGPDMRLFYSREAGAWTEVPIDGSGLRGAGVAALDDTTALVVWLAGIFDPGRAVLLRGSVLQEIGTPPFKALGPLAAVPVFRPRPSGGHWMAWPTYEDHAGIATFRDGVWSSPESLTCAYRLPEGFRVQSIAYMSNDDAEYPVVAWAGLREANLMPTICVCVPTDAGFPVAENLVDGDFGVAPVVARDRHGDVWVAWWTEFDGWLYWLHSYTTATASKPQVSTNGPAREVQWTLSEPAPGSWWAVLRARNDGTFEEVSRVKAGDGLGMSWTDLSPAGGVLRYRIRRECLDTRYQWESEAASWPPRSNRPLTLARADGGSLADWRLVVTGADAGPIVVRAYDIQGRLVLERDAHAEGSGRDSVQLNARETDRMPNGVYFASVKDGAGRVSNSLKVVLLR